MDRYEEHRGADKVLSDTSSSIDGSERELCQFMSRQRTTGLLGKLVSPHPHPPLL